MPVWGRNAKVPTANRKQAMLSWRYDCHTYLHNLNMTVRLGHNCFAIMLTPIKHQLKRSQIVLSIRAIILDSLVVLLQC